MILVVCYLWLIILKSGHLAEIHDLNHCKLSHNGIEFEGHLAKTESGIPCQKWSSDTPHETDQMIQDEDFVDGSKIEAKNYCRNPNGMLEGPWCYTTNEDISDELCSLSLCSSECRVTLLGSEYSGPLSTTITNRECIQWSEKIYRTWENKTGIKTSTRVLLDNKFPDQRRKKAHKRCRNPTGDKNGPWCFVEYHMSDKKVYQKEYCDVEFCNINTTCSFATSSSAENVYTHFVKIPSESEPLFTPTVLLWNLDDFAKASIRIAFTALPLPLSGKNLRKMNAGIELVISPSKVEFTDKNGESKKKHKSFPKILSGASSRTFQIEWLPNFNYITLNTSSYPNPPTISTEYADESNETLIHFTEGNFNYYSVQGGPALWSVPCPAKRVCEEHITLTATCSMYKKLSKRISDTQVDAEYSVSFFVRSRRTVIIELRNSPATMHPFFQINIFGAFNKTTIHVDTGNGSFSQYLGSATYDDIMSLYRWTKMSLSIVGDTLLLVWVRQTSGPETVLALTHPLLRNTIWYTFCSQTMAHWAFDCDSVAVPMLPSSTEPECVRSKFGEEYAGTQWVADDGQPCLPWIFTPVYEATKDFIFIGTSRLETLNYCRNLNRNKNGPFCYIADADQFPDLKIKRKWCDVPKCQKTECKYSGTGVEYIGTVRIGRSKKHCQISKATGAYCRNPDNNIFGPWCNLTNEYSNIKTDLCFVPDCYVNEACTFITKATTNLSRTYLLHPDWITGKFTFKAKSWDPTLDSGIKIAMKLSANELYEFHYILYVGVDNLNIELWFNVANSNKTLVKSKVIPNIIPRGYWQGFWVKVPPNAIEFGYEGSENAMFSWTQLDPKYANMSANFLSITSLHGEYVGLNFPCSYCLIEKTESPEPDTFYPFNLWSSNNTWERELVLHMRVNNGSEEHPRANTVIYLYEDRRENGLTITINSKHVLLSDLTTSKLLNSFESPYPLLISSQWTELTIKYRKFEISLSTPEMRHFMTWSTTDRRLRFYFFSVVSHGLATTWVANCEAPDLNHPTNGGWGEWGDFTCTVPCGGGFGFRRRQCNSPRPTYYGQTCIGPSTEDGECNQFECGCLNPATIERARSVLNSSANNVEVNEFDDVTMQCDISILQQAQNVSSGSHVQWLKDGFKLPDTRFQLEDLDLRKTNLRIHKAEQSNTGLYMCVVFPDCVPKASNFITIKLIALVVFAKRPRRVRATKPLQMTCHSSVLQFLFAGLSLDWYINDLLNVTYVLANLTEDTNEILVEVDGSYQGIWECRITQSKTNLTWLLNKFELEVIDKPTVFTYLTEEDAPKILFYGWSYELVYGFLYTIITVEVILIAYAVYWFRSARNELLNRRTSANQ